MPHSLKPPVAKLQARQGTEPWHRYRLDVLRLTFLNLDIDAVLAIRPTIDVGHVTAVRVLGPVERQSGHLVVLPGIDRVERCTAPIKGLVRGVINWPVDKDNEFFIFGPDEALPNAVPDEVTEWVVIPEDVDDDDGCCDAFKKRAITRD